MRRRRTYAERKAAPSYGSRTPPADQERRERARLKARYMTFAPCGRSLRGNEIIEEMRVEAKRLGLSVSAIIAMAWRIAHPQKS